MKNRKRPYTLVVIDGIVSVAVLPLSIVFLCGYLNVYEPQTAEARIPATWVTSEGALRLWSVLLFFVLALSAGIRAFRARDDKLQTYRFAGEAVLCLIMSLLLLIFGAGKPWLFAAGIVYSVAVAAGRILSIVRDHKISNILLNLLCLTALGLAHGDPKFLVPLMILRALIHVAAISFSQLNLKVLREVIRRTYAAEVLFGILLLIVSFSFVLPFVEKDISSFGDGLWYCFSLVTTIGFGDITASTLIGRVLSVILGIYGIIVVGVITSVVVNFYNETKGGNESSDQKEGDL